MNNFLDFKIISFAEKTTVESKFQGNGAKGVFICYREKDKEPLSFLTKILSAVKLDLEKDVCSLQLTKELSFSFSTINSDNKFQKAIFFGISPPKVGLQLNLQKYRPVYISNCQFIFADALKEIEANQSLKKLLWTSLQEIFK